ncbi:hypothetical protein [Thiovibrio frasassiensis]|uniref:Uncharacterized protein n=1 Tax=Thiovibrio frasassiensis TaxID=2984131 RepID=A0A9X4RPL4_9BACT|nr:hypothetical protein [Thiovibrio frasassiensis]MDG4475372.1 hypothetical protein [Thiovibrio frasassiensis]
MKRKTNYSEILREKLFLMVQQGTQKEKIKTIMKVFGCKKSWAYKLSKRMTGNDITAFDRILYYQPQCSREDLLSLVAIWHSSWGNETTTIAGVKEVLGRSISAEDLRLMLSLATLNGHVVFSADYLRSRYPPALDRNQYASIRLQPLTKTKVLLRINQSFELSDLSGSQLIQEYANKSGRNTRKVYKEIARRLENSSEYRKGDPKYGGVQAKRVDQQIFMRVALGIAKQRVRRLQNDAHRVGMTVYVETHEGSDTTTFDGVSVEFLPANLVDAIPTQLGSL